MALTRADSETVATVKGLISDGSEHPLTACLEGEITALERRYDAASFQNGIRNFLKLNRDREGSVAGFPAADRQRHEASLMPLYDTPQSGGDRHRVRGAPGCERLEKIRRRCVEVAGHDAG